MNSSPMNFEHIKYGALNARQKEQYNFQKVSGILADYGFRTILLSDDWNGADFIAQHIDGETFLMVQLKGRASFSRKYQGKKIWVCFRDGESLYLDPHDEVLDQILKSTGIADTESWSQHGGYSFPYLSKELAALLKPYRLVVSAQQE